MRSTALLQLFATVIVAGSALASPLPVAEPLDNGLAPARRDVELGGGGSTGSNPDWKREANVFKRLGGGGSTGSNSDWKRENEVAKRLGGGGSSGSNPDWKREASADTVVKRLGGGGSTGSNPDWKREPEA